MTSFPPEHLDPGSYMGEVLFGLIMTLTFTLGAHLVIDAQGSDGARHVMIAILGCNLAWGLIDGVLYVLGCAFERGRQHRLGYEVQAALTPLRARQLVAAELDELLGPLVTAPQRDALYAAIVQRVKTGEIAPPQPVTRKDLLGGLESGLLVFACSLPAVLPLLLFQPRFALWVSNTILLALLYYVGYRHARHTLARPWIAGLLFLLVGLLLVAFAIYLGG